LATEIILIRHGETAWNADRRLQGHIDISLNAEGEHQARALGASLQYTPLAAIISSDLQRARQTAQAVAVWHKRYIHAVQIDKELRERCFGAFEGLHYDEIARRYPQAFAQWQARDADALIPAGEREAESFRQFYNRSIAALTRWASCYQGQSIAVVAHGGVLECAYRAACEIPLTTSRTFPVLNASVNRLSWQDGTFSLLSWGDCEHLNSLPMSLDEVDRRVSGQELCKNVEKELENAEV
jgi:2,3-bisphosphoglycerate-dependent phosphoglycerate mutase